jgi:hypothetical protein
MDGWMEGGREGGREVWREGWRKGESERDKFVLDAAGSHVLELRRKGWFVFVGKGGRLCACGQFVCTCVTRNGYKGG